MKKLIVIALFLNATLLGGRFWQEMPASAQGGGGGEPATDKRFCADPSGDGTVDISDAVNILNFLFTGGSPPYCIAQELSLPEGLTDQQGEILSHMSIVELPIDDTGRTAKTLRISGLNVQIVNGSGSTASSTNNTGNLIVGYQEMRTQPEENRRIGSHNLIVGKLHNYVSAGGLVVGIHNTIGGLYASVSGGSDNTADGESSSVSGGSLNVASGSQASVSGGSQNVASGLQASVSGGKANLAGGLITAVSGGANNRAEGNAASVSGGFLNVASGNRSSVSGGQENEAAGYGSSVSGGGGPPSPEIGEPQGNKALGDYSVVAGGQVNVAGPGPNSTVTGGNNNKALGSFSSVTGGDGNVASGSFSSITGGRSNTAGGSYASVSGTCNRVEADECGITP